MKNSQIIICFLGMFVFFQTELSAQFKVQLIKIKCIVRSESSSDETYISVGDNYKVWHYNQDTHSGDIGSGGLENQDVRSLTHLQSFAFNCPIEIEIWEGDGGGSSDDLLGQFKINMTQSEFENIGEIQSREFGSLGAPHFYRLHYKVLIDN